MIAFFTKIKLIYDKLFLKNSESQILKSLNQYLCRNFSNLKIFFFQFHHKIIKYLM